MWGLNREGGSHYCCCLGRASEAEWISNSSQTSTARAPTPPNTHSSPSCSSTALGQRCWRKSTHVNEAESARSWTKGFFSSNLGPDSGPTWVVMATEQRGSPVSCLAQGSAPHPTTVTAASIPEEGRDLCSQQIQLSHQSHWAHADSTAMLQHKDTLSTST